MTVHVANNNDNNKTPHAPDFRKDLLRRMQDAENDGRSFIDIRAKDVHKGLWSYPARGQHNMPGCCSAMRSMMRPGDEVIEEPPSGKGANFVVRYMLPREP